MSSATSVTTSDPSLVPVDDAPAPFLPRRRTVPLGAALLTGATLMYFGGLFAIYVGSRNAFLSINEGREAAGESTVPWIPDSADVELTAPTMIFWTMLLSAVTMFWASYSFRRNERVNSLLALGVTAMFGGAVINQVVFQWNQLGLVADDVAGSPAPSLIYAITGSHVAMIVVALVGMALLAFRASAGKPKESADIALALSFFWYAAVAVYFVIWILIFITK